MIPDPERHTDIADALLTIARDETAPPRLSLGELVDGLGSQAFGLLVLLLALPNIVPGPLIPGLSIPFAIGIAALGIQRFLGYEAPYLPHWLRRRTVSRARFRRLIEAAAPRLKKMQKLIRPRPSRLLRDGTAKRLVGAWLVLLSLVLALPVPFGNLPMGLNISIIAIGLIENDGIALIVGLLGSITALAWNAGIILLGARLFALIGFH